MDEKIIVGTVKRNLNIALVVANLPYGNDKTIGVCRVPRSGNHENRREEECKVG